MLRWPGHWYPANPAPQKPIAPTQPPARTGRSPEDHAWWNNQDHRIRTRLGIARSAA